MTGEYRFHFRQRDANRKAFPNNFHVTSKYTLLTFLPLNLFEQFHRLANLFFLAVAGVQLIPGVSPYTSIFVTLFPICFMMGISVLKEAIEDTLRHLRDRRANAAKISYFEGGQYKEVTSGELVIGDIVKIQAGNVIPADMIFLSSCEDEGLALIDTANLDGETNLKKKTAVRATQGKQHTFQTLEGSITCEPPNPSLVSFNGVLNCSFSNTPVSLSMTQFLPRGSILREIEYILAVVVYTGKNTKLSLNQKKPSFKRIEHKMNRYVPIMVTLLLTMAVLMNSKVAIQYGIPSRFIRRGFLDFITFFVLHSFIVPMSIYVGLEVSRIAMSFFMQQDREILNDELGQIQFILSDKTGTLTQNEMKFRALMVGSAEYTKEALSDLTPTGRVAGKRTLFDHYLVGLSLCNEIYPHMMRGSLVFRSESTDEMALLEAADLLGLRLRSRSEHEASVVLPGGTLEYEILGLLPFSSEARRMSIVLRRKGESEVFVYTKGADTQLYSLASCVDGYNNAFFGNSNEDLQVRNSIHEFSRKNSRKGYRTLVFGANLVSEEKFQVWLSEYRAAMESVDGRMEKLLECFAFIESGLAVIGASAVEDLLQDNVTDTFSALRAAGIQLAMATGDKAETAINIGRNCGLIAPDNVVLRLDSPNKMHLESKLISMKKQMDDSTTQSFALVSTGDSIELAIDHFKAEFTALFKRFQASIFCRMTPMQKSKLVAFVKDDLQLICLAIGDGGNDISMILEANVGVGLYGKEGNQAVNSSDYAIRKFCHLQRLLFVHGRYNHLRLSYMLIFSFFNNLSFNFPQFLYSFFNLHSGQSIYPDVILTFYNTAFAGPLFLNFGFFLKDLHPDMLMSYPELYGELVRNPAFSLSNFVKWMSCAIIEACTCTFFAISIFSQTHEIGAFDGKNYGLYMIGVLMVSGIIFGNIAVSANAISYWDLPTIFMQFVGIPLFVLSPFSFPLLQFGVVLLSDFTDLKLFGISLKGVHQYLLEPNYWFALSVSFLFAAIVPLFLRFTQLNFEPMKVDIVKEIAVSGNPSRRRLSSPVL